MRKSTKIAVVLAAAALLVAGFAFTSLAGWVKEAEGVYYYEDADGNRVYNEWKKDTDDNGVVKYYYLGDDGYMVTNQLVDDNEGNTFWVGADGAKVVNAWVKVPVDSEAVEDNFDEEYRWYRFDAKGKALKGIKKAIGDYDYLFDEFGRMSFGYVQSKDAKYAMCEKQDDPFQTDCVYFCGTNEDGAVKKLYWEKIEGVEDKGAWEEDKTAYWVFFKKDGAKATEDDEYGVLYNGKRYYFEETGKMKSGWSVIGTPATYTAYLGDEDEGWVEKKAWVYTKNADDKEKWYYTDNRGQKQYAGTVATIKGKQYVFNGAFEMVSGIVGITNVDETTKAIKSNESEYVDSLDTTGYTLKDWEAGTYDTDEALYFFSNDYKNDGSLHKNTSFDAEFADDTYKLYVGKQGQLLDGEVSSKFYKNGHLQAADADFGKQVINVSKTSTANWKVIDAAGVVTKAGKKAKDNDGNWYVVYGNKDADGKIVSTTIYMVPEYVEKASVVADYVLSDKTEIVIDKVTRKIVKSTELTNGYYVVTIK